MSKLNATRSAQYPLVAEFVFNFNDYVTDSVDGVKKTFGSSLVLADPTASVAGLTAPTGLVFDGISMPINAVITGGEVIVETAFVGIGAGATLNVGTAASASGLLSAFDLDAAVAGSRTALLLTAPLLASDGSNLRITTAGLTAAGATAGKVRVRVQYTIDNRGQEVVAA